MGTFTLNPLRIRMLMLVSLIRLGMNSVDRQSDRDFHDELIPPYYIGANQFGKNEKRQLSSK